jgi:ACS family hexuronate transporter-like MFS transporter
LHGEDAPARAGLSGPPVSRCQCPDGGPKAQPGGSAGAPDSGFGELLFRGFGELFFRGEATYDDVPPRMSSASVSVPATSAPVGRYRWVVCGLLFLATTINYIDRQILSLLKPILDDTLHWTNAQFGWVNAAFQLAYAVGLLLFGILVDRFGSRIGYAVSIAVWSLAAISHSAVATIIGFVIVRVALGLGEGGNFPSSIKAVALWFPKKERALATATFNSGSNVGAIIAPAVVPVLTFAFGWQASFVVMGVAGLAWLFLWLPLYNDPDKVARVSPSELSYIAADADAGADAEKLPWREILRYRQAWSFVVAKFITDPVWWFFLIWLPTYFKSTRGLDLKTSWVHLVSIYAMITVLSVGGGWVTGVLARSRLGIGRARKIAMLIFACCVLPILFVTKTSAWGSVILIGIAGAAHQAWSANLFTTVSDMFPKRAVASVVGIGGMAGSLGGFFFPIYAGKLLDKFQASGNITAGYAILFAICGSAYLVAFVVNHLLAPKFEPIDIPAVHS